MDLRRIRYFVAVAEHLHFGEAARRMCVAQPSLSRQIQTLEREIGAKLLVRDTRFVALTPAGREFLAEAREILTKIGHASEVARRAERGELGTLDLGFVYLVALDVLPLLLSRFRKRFPDVVLRLHELSSEAQIAGVREGTLDAGIVRAPTSIRNLASTRLHRGEQLVALPAGHPLTKEEVVRLAELHSENFIMFPRTEGTAMYDSIVAACAKAGFSPHVVQEACLFTTVVGLVAARIGVAILPDVSACIQHKEVSYRRLVPRLALDTGLIWKADAVPAKPALKALVHAARANLDPSLG